MATFSIKPDGTLEAKVFCHASFDYTCQCGEKFTVSCNLPENIIFHSTLNIDGIVCPACGRGIALPRGRYTVRDYKLVCLEESEDDSSFSITTAPIKIASPKM